MTDEADFLRAVVDRSRPRIAAPVLAVLAHPDDEVLGCGALLPRLDDVRIVHVTDGAPHDGRDARRHGFPTPAAYAAARRAELEAATALAGIGPDRLRRLGVPDQEAAGALAEIARQLMPFVAEAEIILTHALEGGHPDHDAVAFAVAAACRLVDEPPIIVEMPFYRAGPGDAWARQSFADSAGVVTLDLTSDEQALKRDMIAAHGSQAATLGSFRNDRELYRVAAAAEWSILPNGGALLYERLGWGLTGPLWLARSAAALHDLGLR